MAKRLQIGAVICLAASLFPASATAGPITDLDLLAGDGFVLRFGDRLTAADLAVLANRDDNGWHLGWFKQKLRTGTGAGSFVVGDPSFTIGGPNFPIGFDPTGPPSFPSVIAGDPALVALLSGSSPLALDSSALDSPTAQSPAVATPEPTSLVLLGSGLLLVARRLRRRGAPRGARE